MRRGNYKECLNKYKKVNFAKSENKDEFLLGLLSLNETLRWINEQKTHVEAVPILKAVLNKAILKYNRLSRDRVPENVGNRLRLYISNLDSHMNSSSSGSNSLVSFSDNNVRSYMEVI
jgi:hypothetical protein